MNGEEDGVHSTMARKVHGCRSVLTGAILGIFIGLLISYFGKQYLVRCGFPDLSICCKVISLAPPGLEEQSAGSSAEGALVDGRPRDTFVFVGIMTAKKFIDSRGLNAFRTWVNSINGKVMFFSSEGSVSNHGVPVVALPGVDDSYPPQKKSFMMLKYMHDHFIDKYEWFVRADDDVFIKGDRLEKFLRSVNSSKPQFIGQAGVGKPEELGLLSLTATENFCMGGPGMIFSRETLRRMAPHVGYCLQNLYTTHEDVEIGRCVRKFAGIQCTWAYEMQQILYQNYKEDKGSFKKTLKSKEVMNAVSLHPVKDPIYQYRIHNYLQSTRIMHGHQRQLQLHREIALMDRLTGRQTSGSSPMDKLGLLPSLNKYMPRTAEEVLEWEFLMKPIFSHHNQNPKRGMEGSLSSALDDIIMQIMAIVNRNARQRGRTIDFKEILYGYRRVNPLYGADYILDLLMIYRKHKGRKMTVPVRRHAYLQQTFLETEFMEEIPYYYPQPGIGAKMAQLLLQMTGGAGRGGQKLDKRSETIHFILPLAGRLRIFQRFMANYEDIVLKEKEPARLHVVLFQSGKEPEAYARILQILNSYKSRYGADAIDVVRAPGDFVRGRGLEHGAARCAANALLFMVDVDIIMRRACLNRIRLNVRQGVQVFFPIVFSQYDPDMVCQNQSPHCICSNASSCVINPWDFSEATGYWRQFGFGIAAMYRSDMLSVGGYDLNIEGWGKEDVDLYGKFIDSNLTVFRSIDPGMTHAFHTITSCDSRLEPAQYQMCVGSKAASYGSESQLANMVYSIADIMHRHEKHTLNINSGL